MVEAAGIKRQHWSTVLVKNMLDAISGIFGFWILGFGLAYGPTDTSGFIGLTDKTFTTSAGFNSYKIEDLNLKWIF